MQVYGNLAGRESVVHLDKIKLETKRGVKDTSRIQRFFIVVFTNLEEKDRIFEGGPYFYVAAGLYICLWMMNFVPERETFTSVPVWIRLYSLPLDYWMSESLKAIGNKLGHFLKIPEATLRGKYTSYACICVEMDLS